MSMFKGWKQISLGLGAALLSACGGSSSGSDVTSLGPGGVPIIDVNFPSLSCNTLAPSIEVTGNGKGSGVSGNYATIAPAVPKLCLPCPGDTRQNVCADVGSALSTLPPTLVFGVTQQDGKITITSPEPVVATGAINADGSFYATIIRPNIGFEVLQGKFTGDRLTLTNFRRDSVNGLVPGGSFIFSGSFDLQRL